MKHMFFSREIRDINIPPRLKSKLEHFACKNVVSHVTFASPNMSRRSRTYGTRPRPAITACHALKPYTLMKRGMPCNHHRINTSPADKNHGKFLVFKSSNMIRAGKFTHAMAMRNTVRFCAWVRRSTGTPYQWHTAMSAPNMVISGKLTCNLPDHVKSHWRATHTSKFPGIAISTDGPCTPELYRSGAFIIPGVTCVKSLENALVAMDEAIHGDQPALRKKPQGPKPTGQPSHDGAPPPFAKPGP